MELRIKSVFKNYLRIYLEKGGFHKEENELRKKFYTESETHVRRMIIFMIDGRSVHGGLTDRLKGICSLFQYAKQKNIPFRINFCYPFKLQDYLEPNKYDWTLQNNDITYNITACKPVLLNTHQFPRKMHKMYLDYMVQKYKQLHIYSNTDIYNEKFYQNFHELFRPTLKLQRDLEKNLSDIGSDFISVTYRFQQLLGDFKERNYPTLNEGEQKKLIRASLKVIDFIHNKYPEKRVLVTSDSVKFLKEASIISYVYVIPGSVVHMDYISDAEYDVYEKSFIDLLMLSHADKIYLAYSDIMYHSGFAYCASLIGNVEYEEIKY